MISTGLERAAMGAETIAYSKVRTGRGTARTIGARMTLIYNELIDLCQENCHHRYFRSHLLGDMGH